MNALAAALGLWFSPMLGSSLLAAFDALGPEAVFGPGCLDGGPALKTVQAPVRWRRGASPMITVMRPRAVTIMAEVDGDIVRSVHLADEPWHHSSMAACRARLAPLPGGTIRERGEAGPSRVFERPTTAVAGHAARYRVIYRASRDECRVMLTIGA